MENTQVRIREALQLLLDPISSSSFLKDYWDKEPLLLQRFNPDHYQSLFEFSDIDRVLNHTNIQRSDVDLFEEKEPYTKPSDAYQAFHNGTSIRIKCIQNFVPELDFLIRDLRANLGFKFNINLYLTPPHCQGLHIHYDRHDVFVMQISGSKHWKVYEPQFILPNAAFQPKLDVREEHLKLLMEKDVHAGDLLYTPRGFPHFARANDQTSVHLTLGVTPYTWKDLLQHMVQVLSEQDEAIREMLPVGSLITGKVTKQMQDKLLGIIQMLNDPIISEVTLERQAKKFIKSGKLFSQENQLKLINNLDEINTRTVLKKSKATLCLVTTFKKVVTLNFPGGALDAPRQIEPLFQYIAQNDSFTADDLPSIVNDDSKLLLIRSLITKGLLSVEEV